jgi:hypothetical protein
LVARTRRASRTEVRAKLTLTQNRKAKEKLGAQVRRNSECLKFKFSSHLKKCHFQILELEVESKARNFNLVMIMLICMILSVTVATKRITVPDLPDTRKNHQRSGIQNSRKATLLTTKLQEEYQDREKINKLRLKLRRNSALQGKKIIVLTLEGHSKTFQTHGRFLSTSSPRGKPNFTNTRVRR